mmetsp:Transcript_1970/g.6415  ORF Transcript_1970/g.6415 Transcript_1970/m.6415 type:complete len:254 (-) Transcript_1970:964-1725(-)
MRAALELFRNLAGRSEREALLRRGLERTTPGPVCGAGASGEAERVDASNQGAFDRLVPRQRERQHGEQRAQAALEHAAQLCRVERVRHGGVVATALRPACTPVVHRHVRHRGVPVDGARRQRVRNWRPAGAACAPRALRPADRRHRSLQRCRREQHGPRERVEAAREAVPQIEPRHLQPADASNLREEAQCCTLLEHTREGRVLSGDGRAEPPSKSVSKLRRLREPRASDRLGQRGKRRRGDHQGRAPAGVHR